MGESKDHAIFTRVSVREFTHEAVSDDNVDSLVRAAMAAPSAGNQQPWEFYLTRDEDMRKRLSECSPYAKAAAKAPLAIVPCMRTGDGLRFPEYAEQDMGACLENILLEATALGLGAVWLGIYPEEDRVRAVSEAMGIRDDLKPFGIIAVGHPAEDISPRSAKRFDPERLHWV